MSIEREPRRRDVVAALGVAEEMLGAVGDPVHRLAGQLGGNRRERIFAIGKQLGAEAAADIGRDDAHLFRRDAEHRLADDIADGVAALAAERQRDSGRCALSYSRDHRAGIHVVGDEPLVDERERHGRGGRLRRLLGLRPSPRSISKARLPGRSGHTSGAIGERKAASASITCGNGLPFDLDRLGGIARLDRAYRRRRRRSHRRHACTSSARQDRITRRHDLAPARHADHGRAAAQAPSTSSPVRISAHARHRRAVSSVGDAESAHAHAASAAPRHERAVRRARRRHNARRRAAARSSSLRDQRLADTEFHRHDLQSLVVRPALRSRSSAGCGRLGGAPKRVRPEPAQPARDDVEGRREDQAEHGDADHAGRTPRCRASGAVRRRRRSQSPAADTPRDEGERRHQDRPQPQLARLRRPRLKRSRP